MSKVLVDRELLPCPFCGETLRVNNANLAVHSRDSDCLLRQQPVVVDDPAQVDRWNRRAQPAEAEVVVTKIECTTCRGTGSLEFEGGAVVKDCAPCKGTGRDLKAERYALAARLSEAIAALSAVTAERDRLRGEVFGLRISLKDSDAGLVHFVNRRDQLGMEVDKLRAEVEGLRKDAERYRWASSGLHEAETLASIVHCHGGYAEKVAERVDVYREAAISAQQSAHVSVPRELLEDLRDCANECYNHARFRGTSGLDTYERLTEEADALLNGGEA